MKRTRSVRVLPCAVVQGRLRMLMQRRIPSGSSDAHERELRGIVRGRLGRGWRYQRDPGGLQGGREGGGGKGTRGEGEKGLRGQCERKR